MRVAVSTRVAFRNSMGQYRAECSNAARKTIAQSIMEGAELSRGFAPVGDKPDPRTVKLKDSIVAVQTSRTQGFWQSSARHALPQEFGAADHPIPAGPATTFWWDREGRYWDPAPEGSPQQIDHPGNAPQPYLKPAYEIIRRRMMRIAKQHYPG